MWLNHPYTSNTFWFRGAHYFMQLAFLTGFLGIYYSSLKRVFLGSLLIAIALGFYQIVINYLIMIIFGFLALNMLFKDLKNSSYNSALMSGGLTLGTIGYFILQKLSLSIFGVEQARLNVVSLDEIGVHIKKAILHFPQLFLHWDPLIYTPIKGLLLLLFGIATTGILINFFINKSTPLKNIIFGFFYVFLAFISIIGCLFLIQPWYPNPRVMATIGLFWSLITFIAFKISNGKKYLRKIVTILSIITLFSFTAKTNQIFSDRFRTNIKDHFLINRIIGRLETRNDFSNIKRIAILGIKRHALEIPTQYYDLNVSALGASWAIVPLIYEITGYKFEPMSKNECVKLMKHCSKGNFWPSKESIYVEDDLALICISEYEC